MLAPIARGVADLGEHLARLRKEGYVRALIDDQPVALDELDSLENKRSPRATHDLDVVVDRVVVKHAARDALRVRVTDSVELSLRLGDGKLSIDVEAPDGSRTRTRHSERFACENDGFTFPKIEPRLFSFNSPEGACPTCEGLGSTLVPIESRVVPDDTKTLREGAIAAFGAVGSLAHAIELKRAIDATSAKPDVRWKKLSVATRRALLDGVEATKPKARGYEGVLRFVTARLADGVESRESREDDDGALDEDALRALCEPQTCATCGGERLRREALAVKVGGLSIAEVGALPLPSAREHLVLLLDRIDPRWLPVAQPLLGAIAARLHFLREIGLHYLTIDRPLSTMSGGEVSRLRLSTQLASGLKGVLYVLDEPTVGLHARDTERLIEVLRRLRALGNTVIVVEHDLDVLRAADHVIDVGPVAGRAGGHVVAAGSAEAIRDDPRSVTGPWLSGAAQLPRVQHKPIDRARTLKLRGCTLHNLRAIDVDLPLSVLVAITGVSGSGKSSLIEGTLLPAMRAAVAARGRPFTLPPQLRALEGHQAIDKVVAIDQAPIGRTPRSSPASYVGVMPRMRELFAALPSAAARGYKPGRFSPNVKGGRCEVCKGEGVVRIEMSFLPDVYVVCSECGGARFNRETLEIRYRGRSIADVLDLNVDDAHALFDAVTPVRERLQPLRTVGLGYLQLGQPATTLSGGEAQRIKLARELARKATGQTLYLLDEPTTGLHPNDVAILLEALVALRDQGNSIVVVEHNLELVARADYVIDVGPDAGDEGGRVVAHGTPRDVARAEGSVTARYLARALGA